VVRNFQADHPQTPQIISQNRVDYLAVNMAKELMEHRKAETTLEFYNQVEHIHEAKAARVIQNLLESEKRPENQDKTDAKMTQMPIFSGSTKKAAKRKCLTTTNLNEWAR